MRPSLSHHLNYIIIRAAGATDVPAVYHQRATMAIWLCWRGERRRRRWGRGGGCSGGILGQEAGPTRPRSGSRSWEPTWKHGTCVETGQRLAVRKGKAWWQHFGHASKAAIEHEWRQGTRKQTGSLHCCRGWHSRGRSHCRGSGWGGGRRRIAAPVHAEQIFTPVSRSTQLGVGWLKIRRTSSREERMSHWPTQHRWVQAQWREAITPTEGEALCGHRGWGVLASRGQFAGLFIHRRRGGFTLRACPRVLSLIGVRGNVVVQSSSEWTAFTAAVGLKRFGGMQTVDVVLWLTSRHWGDPSWWSTCVTLQLTDDLWAVRWQRTGHRIGCCMLPFIRWQAIVTTICWDFTRWNLWF